MLESYLATDCYKQRCLLIGNVVYGQSGFIGREINCGIQDAYNIGWKLANICLGKQEESLLNTYREERKNIYNDHFKKTEWFYSLFKWSRSEERRVGKEYRLGW